jgi:branched-chain amino acid transport system ATP-binding protein
MSTLLEMRNLQAFYDKSHVLRGVDLSLQAGEIVALLGRNGSGRSTLLKAAIGLVRATGSIRFGGSELIGLKTFEIAQRGIGYVPETRAIFPTLTVAQNLLLGEKQRSGRQARRWSIDDMYQLFPPLKDRRQAPAGVLSGGEQQMLALSRTLVGEPELILVDEPTEGLAPQYVALVADCLQQISRRGVAVLLVEQKLAIALDIAQRLYVLGHGAIVFEGTPQQLRANPAVCREWLAL